MMRGENSRRRTPGNARKAGGQAGARWLPESCAPAKAGALRDHAAPFPISAPAFAGARSPLMQPARDGLKRKTGPVLPPAPSEVPAGAFRPRSVPNRVPEEQAPLGPDPGRFEASFSPSLQTSRGKPRFRLFGRLSGKPATILEHPSGKPAIVRLRLFSTGRTRLPDRPFLSGRTLRGRCGLPSSKLSGRPFAIPLPEGSGLAGLRKSGFGFGSPRCLALLPGCPTRASLASFPKDLGPLGTGGVWSFFPVAGWSLLTARNQNVRVARFAQRDS